MEAHHAWLIFGTDGTNGNGQAVAHGSFLTYRKGRENCRLAEIPGRESTSHAGHAGVQRGSLRATPGADSVYFFNTRSLRYELAEPDKDLFERRAIDGRPSSNSRRRLCRFSFRSIIRARAWSHGGRPSARSQKDFDELHHLSQTTLTGPNMVDPCRSQNELVRIRHANHGWTVTPSN